MRHVDRDLAPLPGLYARNRVRHGGGLAVQGQRHVDHHRIFCGRRLEIGGPLLRIGELHPVGPHRDGGFRPLLQQTLQIGVVTHGHLDVGQLALDVVKGRRLSLHDREGLHGGIDRALPLQFGHAARLYGQPVAAGLEGDRLRRAVAVGETHDRCPGPFVDNPAEERIHVGHVGTHDLGIGDDRQASLAEGHVARLVSGNGPGSAELYLFTDAARHGSESREERECVSNQFFHMAYVLLFVGQDSGLSSVSITTSSMTVSSSEIVTVALPAVERSNL